jgi:gliding motility-associated-like protein
VLNLTNPGSQGMTFHTYVPPSLVVNSSPILDSITVPYICAADTNGFPNVATDPDGDQLIFTFVTPYDGGGGPIPDPWTFPPSNVTYAGGYSQAQPFGAGGYTFLNAVTGNTEYYPANQTGQFVVTIEITEYRGSNIVGITRRDLQLISIACPPNPKPKLTNINGSGVTNHTILEGDTLCFPVIVADDFGDSLVLQALGSIFDSTFTNPPAIMADTSGDSIVTTAFCWTTICGQASDTDYTFTVKVADNGCPPKTAFIDYVISVQAYDAPDTINGPVWVCSGDTNIEYTVADNVGAYFYWTVTGGTLVSGDSTSNAVIDWSDAASTGTITIVTQSPEWCWGDTLNLTIDIRPLPQRYAGWDTTMCSGDTIMIGDTAQPGHSYSWSPSDGLNSIVFPQPMLTLTNDSIQPDTHAYIRTADLNGCQLDDTLDVVVFGLPALDTIFGSPYVCPGITGVDYYTAGGPVTTYSWWATNGTVASSSGDSVKIDWDSIPGTGMVYFIETTGGICVGDTVSKSVRINPVLTPPAPAGPDTVCDWDKDSVVYEAIYTVSSSYTWSVVGGTVTSGQGTYQVVIDWDTIGVGSGQLWFEELSSVDTVCQGFSDTLVIDIFANPVTSVITGPMEVCAFDSGYLYSVIGSAGSSYLWTIQNGTIAAGQGTDTISVTWDSAGTRLMTVTETSVAGCVGALVDTTITVHVEARSNTILGDVTMCYPFTTGKLYSVIGGEQNSAYAWSIINGTITSGGANDSVAVDWNNSGPGWIHVVETTTNGCVGDTVTLAVLLDDPQPELIQVTTNYTDYADVDVNWLLYNNYLHNGDFELFSQQRPSSVWTPRGLISGNSFKDTSLPTATYSYAYMVRMVNQCGDTIESLPQNSIVLEVEKDELRNTNDLVWNVYNNWPGGVFRYEIWRKLDDDMDYAYYTNALLDTAKQLANGEDGYVHCYRIRALKANDTAYSWSNEFCVEFDHFVEIPTAFTPNGDGKNETFFIDHVKLYPEAELQVFNRWGGLVYESGPGYDNTWDGSFQGEPMPDGTYFYILNLNWTGEKDRDIFSGHVTIIR